MGREVGGFKVGRHCLFRDGPSLRLKAFTNSTHKKKVRDGKQGKREKASHGNSGFWVMKEGRLSMHWLEACYEFKLQSVHQKSSRSLEQCAQKQEDIQRAMKARFS